MNPNDSNDDESYDNLLSQALPVGDLPSDKDPSVPPATGEEYLSRVRLEAIKCPDVVVASNIPLKEFENKRSILIYTELMEEYETPQELLPKVEWQRKKCIEFTSLRLQIAKRRDDFIESNKEELKKHDLPKIEKESAWHEFCFGCKLGENEETTKDHEAIYRIQEPLLSILYRLEQTSILHLFDYHVAWFEKRGYSETASKWLYALMAFLEKPLLPETYSSLRKLARICFKYRSKLSKNDETGALIALNLMITIIGRYFEQFDLINS